jgi:hypothetical protein
MLPRIDHGERGKENDEAGASLACPPYCATVDGCAAEALRVRTKEQVGIG